MVMDHSDSKSDGGALPRTQGLHVSSPSDKQRHISALLFTSCRMIFFLLTAFVALVIGACSTEEPYVVTKEQLPDHVGLEASGRHNQTLLAEDF